MCKQNINATITLYTEAEETNSGTIFKFPFKGIVPIKEGNEVYINNFYIVANLCLMKTSATAEDDVDRYNKNVVNHKGKLECRIQFCRVDNNFNDLNKATITDFDIDLSDTNGFNYNERRNILSPKIYLNADNYEGKYLIRFCVKRHTIVDNIPYDDETYELQAIAPLDVLNIVG